MFYLDYSLIQSSTQIKSIQRNATQIKSTQVKLGPGFDKYVPGFDLYI
jgi:hypothetical protein